MGTVVIVCTKCGKANDVPHQGVHQQVRCVSCSKIISVGGRPRGLKAVPIQEIGMAIGMLTIIGIVVALITYEKPEEYKLDWHVTEIERVSQELIEKSQMPPEWEDIRMLYATPTINEDYSIAWAKVAYTYNEQGFDKTVEFAAKYVIAKKWEEKDKFKPQWRVQGIGVLDDTKEEDVLVIPQDATPREEAKLRQEFQKKKQQLTLNSNINDDDWANYRWFPLNIEVKIGEEQLRIIRGQRVELKPVNKDEKNEKKP